MSNLPPALPSETSLCKNGDVQERWFSAYRCEVILIRVILLDLKYSFTYGHWKPQGLNLLWGSTTTAHTLSSQRDWAHDYIVSQADSYPDPTFPDRDPLTWATVDATGKKQSKVTQTPVTATEFLVPKRHESQTLSDGRAELKIIAMVVTHQKTPAVPIPHTNIVDREPDA